jgi:hypothetical protein
VRTASIAGVERCEQAAQRVRIRLPRRGEQQALGRAFPGEHLLQQEGAVVVGPLEVIHHEHQLLLLGETTDELSHGRKAAEPELRGVGRLLAL